MSENPYEYFDESPETPPVDGSACPFPKTPFVISLRYRKRPCTLTVFGDHLLIEGEKLPEPVRVERNESFRFRFWSVIACGDLSFLYRKKKLKFKVRKEPQIFLKLGRLTAWQQCLHDPHEASEKAEEKSQNLILLWPKIFIMLCGCELFMYLMMAFMIYPQSSQGSPADYARFPLVLLTLSCVFSYMELRRRNRRGLWFIPITVGGLILYDTLWSLYRHFFLGRSPEVVHLILAMCVMWLFIALIFYLPYRQLKRLDRQIRETRGEDDLPVS